jgi:transposase-like protein
MVGMEGMEMSKVVNLGNGEVSLPRPKRRFFSVEFKSKFLAETDACKGTGQVAALLRREGLYSSALTEWRRARAAGLLGALDPGKPGPKPQGVNPLAAENKRLQKEKRGLERRLRRAELLLEIQKKASELMGIELDQQLQDDESE